MISTTFGLIRAAIPAAKSAFEICRARQSPNAEDMISIALGKDVRTKPAHTKFFRADAEALYKTPPRDRKVSLQDVVQARVEIGRQEERQLTLERMREVAVARINTLMHLPPDGPLPPPPTKLTAADALPAWMERFVDFMATKEGLTDMLRARARLAEEEHRRERVLGVRPLLAARTHRARRRSEPAEAPPAG